MITIEYKHNKRMMVRREYIDVETTLREIFTIPSNEAILSFEWDKHEGVLRLITLKD